MQHVGKLPWCTSKKHHTDSSLRKPWKKTWRSVHSDQRTAVSACKYVTLSKASSKRKMKISELICGFDCKMVKHLSLKWRERRQKSYWEMELLTPQKFLKNLIKIKQLKDKVIGVKNIHLTSRKSSHTYVISSHNKIISFLYGSQVY